MEGDTGVWGLAMDDGLEISAGRLVDQCVSRIANPHTSVAGQLSNRRRARVQDDVVVFNVYPSFR